MSREAVKTALKNIDLYWAKDALRQIQQDEETIGALYETINEQQDLINEQKDTINALTVENEELKGKKA